MSGTFNRLGAEEISTYVGSRLRKFREAYLTNGERIFRRVKQHDGLSRSIHAQAFVPQALCGLILLLSDNDDM